MNGGGEGGRLTGMKRGEEEKQAALQLSNHKQKTSVLHDGVTSVGAIHVQPLAPESSTACVSQRGGGAGM